MITSPSNPQVRSVAALHKRSEREQTGLFLIEGRPEVERAAAAGIELVAVYRLSGSDPFTIEGNHAIVELGESAFQKLAYGRDGIVATAVAPAFDLEALLVGGRAPGPPPNKESEPALILVVESIEKPGNLGAIIRSADGAGAALIVADPVTDLVNPNVVRASIGSLFTVPVATASSAEAISYLQERSITICVAVVGSGAAPWAVDLTGPAAIAIGSEHSGLSLPWSRAADHEITLPLSGNADSLNASVSAAVILYEAVRQRSG
jgi:TrmH family RNA methyltransferase